MTQCKSVLDYNTKELLDHERTLELYNCFVPLNECEISREGGVKDIVYS